MAATVTFRQNRPKDKNGDFKTSPVAILIRYYHRGVEVEMSTEEKVVPSLFTGTRVDKSVDRSKQINKVLSDLENRLLNVPYDHPDVSQEEEEFIVRAIMKRQPQRVKTEKYGQKKTSLFTVGRFLAQCRRELNLKTVGRYKVVWRVLSRFMQGRRLDFSTFDMAFHDRFKNFLYDTPNPNYTGYHLEYDSRNEVYVVTPGEIPGHHIGLLDEVVFKYLVILKTICDWATDRGYKVHQSHKDWPILRREYEPITFNLQEVEAIESLPSLGTMLKSIRINNRESYAKIDLDFVKDYISFACRTGPRISDVKRFRPTSVSGDTWTVIQKKGNRQKQNVVKIPLKGFAAPAKLILEKYNYQFPEISEPLLNIGIKEVAARANITQPMFIERYAGGKKIRIPGAKNEFVSTHTCKKSFITILASEGVPISVISKLTGTSQRTIERHYLGNIDTEKLADYMEKAGQNKSVMRIAN